MNKDKKIYIIVFLILVLPPILSRIGYLSGDLILSKDFAMLLSVVSKIGIIILTVWYALKIKISTIWSWVLGFATLLPLGVWISLVILLARKEKVKDKPIEPEKIIDDKK